MKSSLLRIPALLALSACLAACSSMPSSATKAPTAAEAQQTDELIALILSLPKFRYHEASVAGFTAALQEARSLPQNRIHPGNHLFCPGDGTFSGRDFIWDAKTQIMEVRVDPMDGDGPSIDHWKKTGAEWVPLDRV